jgi:hypothetical protein
LNTKDLTELVARSVTAGIQATLDVALSLLPFLDSQGTDWHQRHSVFASGLRPYPPSILRERIDTPPHSVFAPGLRPYPPSILRERSIPSLPRPSACASFG